MAWVTLFAIAIDSITHHARDAMLRWVGFCQVHYMLLPRPLNGMVSLVGKHWAWTVVQCCVRCAVAAVLRFATAEDVRDTTVVAREFACAADVDTPRPDAV